MIKTTNGENTSGTEECLYADVIVDIAHSSVDRVFQYAIPQGMDIMEGQRVIIPFGRGNSMKEGYVLGLSNIAEIEPSRIKPIERLADGFNAILPGQIELAKWMAKRYRCLVVEALRLMIPAQMRGDRVKTKTMGMARIAVDGDALKSARDALSGIGGRAAPRQAQVFDVLVSSGGMSVSDVYTFFPESSSALRSLVKKGFVCIDDIEVRRKPYTELINEQKQLALTDEQEKALSSVLNARPGSALLIHGATGSGKTEVYMRAIQHCLGQGKTAIVMVPEISLTPQMLSRFRGRFGDMVAVLHSRLSAGERYDEWMRIRRGDARVVIGPRSAAFAPVANLGLVVIDEEHEQSYRNEQRPQFTAHEVAAFRCRQAGAVLVLGSATPSVETYKRCADGHIQLVEMPHRISDKGLPSVTVVDMRDELMNGNRSIFSSALYNALNESLESGQQAILFINRRGYSSFLMCRGCGHVIECEDCDVSMTYHRSAYGESLRCHYCGRQGTIPATCPSCGKPYLKQFGVGTQQVEEAVLQAFPQARTLRMDLDTTRGKDSYLKILQSFGRKEADILIGTQMIAKGLDFADVTLVGVIAADSTLSLPDYRSPERTFQLIMQVAGRAGRDKLKGNVVVQSYNPEHFAIQAAAEQDYKSFYKQEMQKRRIAQFPPYTVFLRLLFRGQGDVPEQAAGLAYQRIERYFAEKNIKALQFDCGPAPISRIKGESRQRVLIKLLVEDGTDAVIGGIYSMFEGITYEGCVLAIETNPPNML